MALSEESFLPDAEDCAETWRALRWPDGPECVECGSPNVAVQDWDYLSSLRRYECRECGRWFNDRSGTFLESSKVRLPKWIYVLREMDKGRSINSIAKDLPHTYKTVHGMATTMQDAIYQRREEWRGVLTGEVEASGRAFDSWPARPDAPPRGPMNTGSSKVGLALAISALNRRSAPLPA
jgi:transposase-like protein